MNEIVMQFSQVFVLASSIVACTLITSTDPKRRIQAFALFLISTVPDVYISVVCELWVFVAIAPYYVGLNIWGIRNNLKLIKESKC